MALNTDCHIGLKRDLESSKIIMILKSTVWADSFSSLLKQCSNAREMIDCYILREVALCKAI